MGEIRIGRRDFLRSFPLLVATVLLGGCEEPDRRPTGLRLLLEKRKKLRPDMSIGEVDAVMVGHPRKERREERRAGTLMFDGRRMTRPSVLSVSYDDKPEPRERDWGLDAYFDKDGLLVGVDMNEYIK
jgi:hypothetical protein